MTIEGIELKVKPYKSKYLKGIYKFEVVASKKIFTKLQIELDRWLKKQMS